jgi:Na+/H+ antiporter NhaD/arsenite permease-like protein
MPIAARRSTGLFAALIALATVIALPAVAFAGDLSPRISMQDWIGPATLAIFFVAYALVVSEEFTHLRKSKPVMLAAGLIWALIGWHATSAGLGDTAEKAVRAYLLEYAELMLFLIVAMTYINAMEERQVFEALRHWLVARHFSLRQLFWVTGLLAFFISAAADNLTTALLMAAVVMAVGAGHSKFIALSCINLVVAANAGGAFSPFGDITTLMVWQKNVTAANGTVDFWSFFMLFIPALVNWGVPAAIMHFAVPKGRPDGAAAPVQILDGGIGIVLLFVLTIATAVGFHHFLHLPPVLGMMAGLALLKFHAYSMQIRDRHQRVELDAPDDLGGQVSFDVFRTIARAEWDTLFFFYGVVMCVGGLGYLGYLAKLSTMLYAGWGPTAANVAVGLISAVVDNIPVMFAVLTMSPDMSVGQWMLVTLTAGVGGSLLSIGSAAGVALMGQARGTYTFFGHLRWMPAIAAGYAASIMVHLWLNAAAF